MPKGIYPRNNPTPRTFTWQHHLPNLIASVPTESDAIAYLTQQGILSRPKEYTCPHCGYVGCRVKSKKDIKGLKCNRSSCGKSLSLLRGTIFAGSRTPLHQSLYVCIFFLALAPPSTVISQLHCSSNTVSYWYSKLRKWILHNSQVFDGEHSKKEHVIKRARKKDGLEHGAVAVWRERNIDNLWEAFLELLKCHSNEMMEVLDENCFEGCEADVAELQIVVGHPELLPMHDYLDEQGELRIKNMEGGQSEIANSTTESVEMRWNPLIGPESEMQRSPMQTTRQLQSKRTRNRLVPEHVIAAGVDVDLHAAFDNTQPFQQQTDESEQMQIEPALFNGQPTDEPNEQTKKRAKKTYPIPSFLELCCLVPTEEKAVEYLSSYSIFTLPKDTVCNHCGYKGFRQKQKNNPKSLKCNRCSKGRSITRGTFFEYSKASLRTILHLAAHWLHETPRADTISQLKCSSATLTEFHRNFRKLIAQSLDEDLRLMAVTADRKAIAIPKGARRGELEEHCCVAMWREVNKENLWEAFLSALQVCYPIEPVYVGHSIHEGDRVWVDGEKGTACCKYHLKHQLKDLAPGQI